MIKLKSLLQRTRSGHDGAFWFKQYSASKISKECREGRRQFVSLRPIVPLMKAMRNKPSISLAEARNIYRQHEASIKTLRGSVKEEAQHLIKIIKAKQKELQLTNKDTIIAGFSQGGFLGLYLALTQEEPFLCMINFSGGMVEPEQYHNTSTPICFIHGENDPWVSPVASDLAKEVLAKQGIKSTIYKLPGVEHEVSPGLPSALRFIKNLERINIP